MNTPFPGMDPYLEAPGNWPDVHHTLITTISDQLQANCPPGYRAALTIWPALEYVEFPPRRNAPRATAEHALSSAGDLMLEPAPLVLPALLVVPVEYAQIEIRTTGDRTLVTAIELLSPANKCPGADGADAYERKRQEIFASDAHLLEIDLLRAGRRPRLARPLPEAPYFIFLSRVQRRPQIEIWPLSLRLPIKPVPVPLRHPDPPVALDLGAAIHDAYRRARYDQEIDYRAPPPPPDLAPDDAAWLDAFLREAGRRNA
ncbi:MAG: DUF4058 family protein [Roseiflexaceae bacterium]